MTHTYKSQVNMYFKQNRDMKFKRALRSDFEQIFKLAEKLDLSAVLNFMPLNIIKEKFFDIFKIMLTLFTE